MSPFQRNLSPPASFFYSWFQTSSAVSRRSALFWDITRRRLVVNLPTFRDNLSVPSFMVKQSKNTAWRLKMVPIGCPETFVTNYQEECRFNSPKLTPSCGRTLAELLPGHQLWEREARARTLCGKGFLFLSPLALPMSVQSWQLQNELCLREVWKFSLALVLTDLWFYFGKKIATFGNIEGVPFQRKWWELCKIL
jgi:hypothetical protein